MQADVTPCVAIFEATLKIKLTHLPQLYADPYQLRPKNFFMEKPQVPKNRKPLDKQGFKPKAPGGGGFQGGRGGGGFRGGDRGRGGFRGGDRGGRGGGFRGGDRGGRGRF